MRDCPCYHRSLDCAILPVGEEQHSGSAESLPCLSLKARSSLFACKCGIPLTLLLVCVKRSNLLSLGPSKPLWRMLAEAQDKANKGCSSASTTVLHQQRSHLFGSQCRHLQHTALLLGVSPLCQPVIEFKDCLAIFSCGLVDALP